MPTQKFIVITRIFAVLVATGLLASPAGAQQDADAEAATAPDAAPVSSEPEQQFFVGEFRVLGNSTLDTRTIEAAVYPHMGPDRSIRDVEAARDALVNEYRARGYGAVFVDIPEQDVSSGIVRLGVSEGRLDRVRVTGARYFSNGKIRSAMPSLERGEVLNFQALQRDLGTVAQQSRDRKVTPVLKAGRAPGLVDLDLRVEDSLPLHGSLEVNDRYTADTSETRLAVNLSFDNLFQKFHSLSLQYQTAPEEPNEVGVIAATYLLPVGQQGQALAIYAVDTDSDVATVGGLSVLGTGRIYGTRFIQPLPARGESYFQSLNFGVDFKDFDENIQLADGNVDLTPISYLAWSLQYSGIYRAERTSADFTIGPTFGVRRIANQSSEFAFKRFSGDPNFVYLRATGAVETKLPGGWRAHLRLAGQYSPGPLVSNEQFSVGGVDSVRGFLEADELGDSGLSGSIELRTPTLFPKLAPRVSQFYAFAFTDAGIVTIEEALGGQARRADLSSVGLGLRLGAFDGLEAALDWAYPLVPSDRTLDGDSRFHFKVRYGF
jgi:hemolysin activation/secretion protein